MATRRTSPDADDFVQIYRYGLQTFGHRQAHNILYTIVGGDVLVLRIVHSSVDWVRLFDTPE